MIKLLRRWFCGPDETLSTIEALKATSSDILDVFSNTATELELVNEEIKKEMDIREEALRSIKEEQEALTKLQASNNKVIKKIDQFLND